MLEDTGIEVDLQQLRPGLYVLRAPLPVRLDPVNCYIAEADDGLVVIDTGLAAGAVELWAAALSELGARPADVRRICITHFHPDHIGASGPLAELTGAEVIAAPLTVEQSLDHWGPGRVAAFARLDRHLRVHGFPDQLADQLLPEVDRIGLGVRLAQRMEQFAPEQRLRFAGQDWAVVPTPGHADGHVCLHARDSGELLAGDHLLERISPAVGLFPHHDPDPLGSYLESLERTAALGAGRVLPGHGSPFGDAAERCRELATHHAERVEACVVPLQAGERIPAWEIAREVFPTGGLDPANQRFALTETLAHLEYARARGRASRVQDDDGRWYYAA